MEAIWEAHLEADQFLTDAGVDIRQVEGDRAYYRLSADGIVLPKWEQFSSANHCYQTALHEMGHATGHPERMNRESLIEGLKAGFGSEAYAREELRAEISAMMTGETIRIGHGPSRVAYAESWIEVLEKDLPEIRRAAADAAEDLRLRSRSEPAAGGTERATSRQERSLSDPTECSHPATASPTEEILAGPWSRFLEGPSPALRYP